MSLYRVRDFEVSQEHAASRLDQFLHCMLPRLSRNKIQTIIHEGFVSLRSETKPRPNRRLQAGDVVTLRQKISPTQEERYEGDLPVLYEDEDLLVINKPALIACHPTARYLSGTILDRTGYRLAHRLDRETSGVLVLAKNAMAEAKVQDAFRQRQTLKCYLAWVEGCVELADGVIDAPMRLAPNARVRLRMELHPEGLSARTRFVCIEARESESLVRVMPETGRQHQIRLHRASIKHPILGDRLYQMGEDFFLRDCDGELTDEDRACYHWPRMLLHAQSLCFRHWSGRDMYFEAPVPSEFYR
jgi:23S rRNA pseudouridine1911/1915/1917 synthase